MSNQDRGETSIPDFLPQQQNTWGLSSQQDNYDLVLTSDQERQAREAAIQNNYWFPN